MNIVDSARKTVATTVSNPKPLYFAAGVGDAAVAVLKDAPALLTEAGARAGEVATSVAGKVAGVAETVQSKIALGQLQDDAKALRERIAEPDLRAAREKAQTLLLMQVGRALEVAGRAVETYDEYSERGKTVVDRVLAGRTTEVEVVTVEETRQTRTETVKVEAVVVEDEKAEKVEETAKAAETPAAPTAPTAPTAPAAAAQPKPKAAPAAKKATPRRTANGSAAKKADQV